MYSRSVRLLATIVSAVSLTGCTAAAVDVQMTIDHLEIRTAVSTLDVDVHSPGGPTHSGVVVLIDGSDEAQPSFVSEIIPRLTDAGYSVMTLPTVSSLTGTELDSVLQTAYQRLKENQQLSLFAFGDAGPGAWKALESSKGLVRSAVLVSAPLPEGEIDFTTLAVTGIRGFYAERSASYERSYWKAHLTMRDLSTPHDFLVYGGGLGDDYYEDSMPLARSTWEATITASVEWLDIWRDSAASDMTRHNHG